MVLDVSSKINLVHTALPSVMRYKNPTPNPLPASDEGAKMYLIRVETAVISLIDSMMRKSGIYQNTHP